MKALNGLKCNTETVAWTLEAKMPIQHMYLDKALMRGFDSHMTSVHIWLKQTKFNAPQRLVFRALSSAAMAQCTVKQTVSYC